MTTARWRVWMLLLAAGTATADLRPETKAAFQNYVTTQEKRIQSQSRSEKHFLWIDQDAGRKETTRNGGIPVQNVGAPTIPDGMIQHWVGGTFIANTTIEKLKTIDQDYARHKLLFQPDIVESKILSRRGDHFQIFYRFKKKKVLTVVLDTVHEVDYVSAGPKRLYVKSTCENVREVEDAGERSEKVLAEGEGEGFLWAMNSYWRMEERDGGVAIECEAITLARTVPKAMRGIVGPIVDAFAAESLTNTLTMKKRVAAEAK